jgi:HlyD family secretion protein
MMQTELLPARRLGITAEVIIGRRSRFSQSIYLSSVSLLIAALLCLPLIKVNVSFQSPGVIRPAVERQTIRARSSGYVSGTRVVRGATVRKGDTLLVLDHEELNTTEGQLSIQMAETKRRIEDLALLASLTEPTTLALSRIRTPMLRQNFLKYSAEQDRRRISLRMLSTELARMLELATRDFVSKQEIESKQEELEVLRADVRVAHEEKSREWEALLADSREALLSVEARNAQISADRKRLSILAPITGSVDEMSSVSIGSFVQAAEELFVLSPDTQLWAEILVSTKDIGLVRPSMPVRLMIDAFDFNSWGVVEGTVTSIPRDYSMIDGKPVFRVICEMTETKLKQRSGAIAKITKGLTFRARFLVTERSLFQLLYERIDEQFNPLRAPTNRNEV